MQSQIANLSRELSVALFPSLITPRPVVLIGTVDPDTGCPNLAPFSSVSFVANQPPMVAVSFGKRRGQVKDTFANATSTGQLVINMLTRSQAKAAVAVASTPTEPSDDYLRAGFVKADFEGFAAGRIADSPAALGCKLIATHDLLPSKSVLMIVEVESIYCDDQFLAGYELKSKRADMIASVGGEQYISIASADEFRLARTWE